MPSVSLPTAIAISAGVSAAGAAVSFVGTREAGIAKADQAQRQANQAKLDSTNKQIQIRQKMLSALASQNAAAGQGGIGTGGSFGANVNRQITQNQSDLMTLNADTSSQIASYESQASSAYTGSAVAAGGSLLDSIGGTASSAFSAYRAAQASMTPSSSTPTGG